MIVELFATSTGLPLACLLIVIGLLLCFKGRSLLKPLIGVVGAGFGAFVGTKLAVILLDNKTISDSPLHFNGVILACSVAFALLAVMIWKLAIFQIVALLGYIGMMSLLQTDLAKQLVRDLPPWAPTVAQLIAVLLPMALASYFADTIVTPAVSSALGSFMVIVGYDYFMKIGIIPLLDTIMSSQTIEDAKNTALNSEQVAQVASGFMFLTVLGAVYQYMNLRNQKNQSCSNSCC